MANGWYGKGLEAFGNGSINWGSDTIKAALVDGASYTADLGGDQYYSAISSAVVGTPVTLASKTNTLGVLDAADVSFTGLTSTPSIEIIVIYKDTGSSSTSPLLIYIDTATGLPVASGATQVDVTWDSGSNKIAKL